MHNNENLENVKTTMKEWVSPDVKTIGKDLIQSGFISGPEAFHSVGTSTGSGS